MQGQPISQAVSADLPAQFEQVRQTLGGQVLYKANGNVLLVVYPVNLGAHSGEVRPSKVGILMLEYSLMDVRQRATRSALQRSLESSGILLILCAIVWVFLARIVTTRAAKLVKASNSIAQGNLDVRTRLQGRDEIAQISTAFDLMAERIQQNQIELQGLANRQELLNQLAAHIRSSLELGQVLSAAVHAIRQLLNIERCKFLWYEVEDDLPLFKLSCVSADPQRSEQLSYYPLQEVKSFRQLVLQQEVVQIDSIATTKYLDEGDRRLLLNHGFVSILGVTLKTRSNRLGMILCENCQEIRSWSNDDVVLLQSVAGQLSIAIDQAEMYGISRATAQASAAQAKELQSTLEELQLTQASAAQAKELQSTLEELRLTQTQLIQTEKMSSLGQLVAGVAHEINNPVSFIYGNLTCATSYFNDLIKVIQLYQQSYPHPNQEIQSLIEMIDLEFMLTDLPSLLASMHMGTERIREIVLSLRNFSRLDEAELKSVDIHEGLDSTLMILQHRLKVQHDRKEIQIIKEYGPISDVECHPGQLNQVFMNLLANAIDALEESYHQGNQDDQQKPMHITIITENETNGFVRIRIRDNGPGMTPETQAKLFDPFFTTKPVGKGTGLGLSISYQVVTEKHQGRLHCQSVLGQGTEFQVEIPKQLANRNLPESAQAQPNDISSISSKV